MTRRQHRLAGPAPGAALSGARPARSTYLPRVFRLVLAVLCLTACGGMAPPPPSAPSPILHRELPRFHRVTLAGAPLDTSALAGRVVVVKFFAAYCGPCQRTLPVAEALHRDQPGRRVHRRLRGRAHRATPPPRCEPYSLTFPVIHDAGNVLAGRFRVTELPATFVVDRHGRVAWVGGSTQESDALRQAVEPSASV